ncbi:hypothetical protein [Ruficoccus sp. ZRK36]|uniref:hypothetical protein n=1 Tax=Ruficoccus sp. ZRK36 TaxID=2866311 RepID=UPI001C72CE70|nr:hypothetical protein [Ruficoccus sp. ZRK36]QYY35194.1 hypothetical protein K0V07_12920 [Ruficoccus sp. ZRK36]
MDDRDWNGPYGHSNWGSRLQPVRRFRWQAIPGWLTLAGIVFCVVFELIRVDWQVLGVATVTRPAHALLGLVGLLWILFKYRPGLLALALWLLTAIPILGFDPSGAWVDFCLPPHLDQSYATWSLVNGQKMMTDYRIMGINLSPLLVAAWLWILTRLDTFPLMFHRRDCWR